MPMTFDHELFLISFQDDENGPGDPIRASSKRLVLCGRRSVTRSEHYQAAATGLKPEIVFVINRHEYQGETEVEFESKRYKVDRTYAVDRSTDLGEFEALELVCSGLIGKLSVE